MATTAGDGGRAIPSRTPDTPPDQLGSGRLTIGPEQIPALAADLTTAPKHLDHITSMDSEAATKQPPERDPYSADAMTISTRTATGGTGAYAPSSAALGGSAG